MNIAQNNRPLVTCNWLKENLNAPRLVILDCTFVLPNQARNAYEEFRNEHIPGAQFFDIDIIADRESRLPHMLPSKEEFSASVGGLGIDNQTKVIVYDNNSFMASARVWWTFRVFGHNDVFVLDGGLKRWKTLNGPVVADTVKASGKQFTSCFTADLVCNLDDMRTLVEAGSHTIIDARSPSRFSGTEPELRPSLRSGHIPGSTNLHYNTLVHPETGELVSLQELETLYSQASIDDNKPIVTTCGSGVTASILALGLFCLDHRNVPVYDGSWSEWGGQVDTAVETGP